MHLVVLDNRDYLDSLGNADRQDHKVRKVILDLPDHQVLVEQLVGLVSLASQVHREIEEIQVLMALLVQLDLQVPVVIQEVLVTKDKREMPAHLALTVPLELRDQTELQVRKEAEVIQAFVVSKGPLVRVVQRDSVVLQDLLVHRDHRVPRATLAQRVRKDFLDRLVCLGRRAMLVILVLKVPKVRLVSLVQMDQQDNQVCQDLVESRERQVQQEHVVTMDLKVTVASLETLELLDQEDKTVFQVQQVVQDQEVSKVVLDLLDLSVSLDSLDLLVHQETLELRVYKVQLAHRVLQVP